MIPMNPGMPQWRFGAVGLVSRALLLWLAGTVLAAFIAATNEHRRTLRTIAVPSGIASVVLAAVGVMFVLDSLQTSSRVNATAQLAFRVASANALVKIIAVPVVTALLARSGWKKRAGLWRDSIVAEKTP